MNMAVPEARCDRAARTVDYLGIRWDLHLPSCAYDPDFAVIDEHNAIAYRRFGRADIERSADERHVSRILDLTGGEGEKGC